MEEYSIPVLDLTDYLQSSKERRSVFISGVGNALRDTGFFALTNHNIPETLISSGYSEMRKLFCLGSSEKIQYEIEGLNGQRGYTSFGKEHAKDSNAPDLKEFWHIGQELQPTSSNYPKNIWPEQLIEFRPTMLDLFSRLESCAFSVLEACALYIGESKDLLRSMTAGGNSILRLIHYPPIPTDRNPKSIRAAAHEDINLITLLIEATSSGLELMDRTNKWIPVVTPRGCIIIDTGDMMQNLTNGYLKSTTHRVVNPGKSKEPRYSMPFFVHAKAEVPLSPLTSCIKLTGGLKSFPDISAGEYLKQRLVEIGLG